jgi:DNA excision repair protein ERCC-2
LRKKKKLAEGETAEQDAPASLAKPLRDFLDVSEQWLSNPQNKTARFRKEIFNAYFEILWFKKVLDSYDECYSTCFNRKGSDLRVKLFCKDPSSRLKIHLERCRSAIFLSATLTPLDYFRQLFGCSQKAGQLTLPSPFPKDNLCTIIHRGISTTFKDRENSKTDLAKSIAEFIRQKPGNYLVFFPSYRYLESVRKVFEEISPETRLIIQNADMTEARREEFLDEFADNTADHLIGFAVMGGFFGEGIDLAGDRLTGAVVVGVGLPGICLERELIRSHFAEKGRNGFDFSYRYPGINRVLQAAGRVIRSENDLGAVMLVGSRFSRYEYQTLLPHEWRTKYVDSHRQISRVLSDFWDG